MIRLIICVLMGVVAGGFISWLNIRLGAKIERAKIVNWLRDPYQSDDDNLGIYFANEIEAGEHLK